MQAAALECKAQAHREMRSAYHDRKALKSLEDAMRIYKKMILPRGSRDGDNPFVKAEARVALQIALVHFSMQENEEATYFANFALKRFQSINHVRGVAETFREVASIAMVDPRLKDGKEQAVESAKKACHFSSQEGDLMGEIAGKHVLASAYQHNGMVSLAYETLMEALVLAQAMGDRTAREPSGPALAEAAYPRERPAAMGKRAGDAGGPSPAKKAAAAAASPAAASGAPPAAASVAPPALCIAQLLETERASMQQGHVKREVSFAVPAKCSLIPPLAIADAAAGANLSSFREVMDNDNLVASFSRTKECEAAGAAWMLGPICPGIDDVTAGQLEGAMGAWSGEAHPLSSKHAPSRRLSFDAPIPALVVDVKVAQRLGPNKRGVCSTEALAILAGRAAAITRHAAMGEALQQSNEDRVWHLFIAALSVPISPPGGSQKKTRRLTSVDNCFAKQEPASKLEAALKAYGLQFKGKARTAATAAALKGLRPFVLDGACSSAFALAEAHFPELRELTLLMRIGFACSTRAVSDAEAREFFVFIANSFRAARLTGDAPKGGKLSVSRELVEYIFHEALLMNMELGSDMAAFKTPLDIQKFAASGADGPAASHRASDSGGGADGMETLFALHVAEHRNAVGVKTKAMIDVARPLWSSAFDDEIAERARQELQSSTAGFVWHTYLAETSSGVGAKHRVFVAARTGGPTPADPELDANLGLLGMSELGDEQKEELQKLQEQLKQLRRKTVKFVRLPSVGAASGAEYAVAQMQSLWDTLSLGHRFGRKKNDVRAFILLAELSPPNVVKQGGEARMGEQMARDEAKFKRVIEFFLQKRQNDGILVFLDGRGRANRRAIESCETKLEPGGPPRVRRALVRARATDEEGRPAVRGQGVELHEEQKGAAIFSMPLKGPPRKVAHRAEFNARGASSTADTSCSGIPMRRFSELPRMGHETKTSLLEAASCASVDGGHPRLQGDIDSKGHPFSHSEVKPLSSGALAVAASGAVECDWLDSIADRCAMCKAGRDEGCAGQFGGDAGFVEKASKYFSGTMMEARRPLMPVAGDGEDGEEEEEGASSGDE
ncbi:unnamed protein product [Prorocentrum cordatum]|uniref:USP domain-containing protein n=1 Tax=Prorocentrum cordatum TaxID=2364126 RepID=A0ABN9VDM5_9DINO|nr:unnamed protein product [Polarella glacialis]